MDRISFGHGHGAMQKQAQERASGDIKKRAVSSPDIAQELGFGPIQIQTAFYKSLNIAINLSTSLTSTWNLGSTWIIVMKVYVNYKLMSETTWQWW